MKRNIIFLLLMFSLNQVFSQIDLLSYNIQSCYKMQDKVSLDREELFNIDRFVKKVIRTYQIEMYKKPYIVKAYYNERAKINGKYQMFTDGIGYLVALGDYIIPRGNLSYLCTNMRKSNRKSEWLDLMHNLYNSTDVEKKTDFDPGYNLILSCFRRFEVKAFFDKTSEVKYIFSCQNSVTIKNRKIYEINFKAENADDLGNKYYEGSIYADAETYRVYRIKFDNAPFYSDQYRDWVKAKFEVNYRFSDNKTYFSKLKSYYKVDNVEYWVEFEITENRVRPIQLSDPYDIFETYVKSPWVRYDPQKWNDYKFSDVKDQKRIRKDLENEILLENQFKNNANDFYSYSVFLGYIDLENELKKLSKIFPEKIKEYEDKYY